MRISARFAKFYDRDRSFNRFNKTRRSGNERQLRCNEAFIFHSTPSDNGRELKRSTELATFREYSVEVAGLWRVVETSNNVDNEVENSHRFVLLPHISHETAKIKSK
ncbi:hypothetical protein ALC57_18846 [Trachymyrmex cornetzi]|uniref:Uncharacterized protein n=1 Tax=Trachymyrmex cornetzi TaxID=471704 RepID=A0A195D7L8_9HYME|nr:hypothetical protein ALC57_18846 [Trachymyrmex cornetzi]